MNSIKHDVKWFCERVGISRSTFDRMKRAGKITYVNVNATGSTLDIARFTEDHVRKFLKSREICPSNFKRIKIGKYYEQQASA